MPRPRSTLRPQRKDSTARMKPWSCVASRRKQRGSVCRSRSRPSSAADRFTPIVTWLVVVRAFHALLCRHVAERLEAERVITDGVVNQCVVETADEGVGIDCAEAGYEIVLVGGDIVAFQVV